MNLKKLLITTLVTLIGFSLLHGENFLKEATTKPILTQKGEGKEWCPICGMKISKYYKTSHSSKLKSNGNDRQYCSLRCLVKDSEEYGIKDIKVVDAHTEKQIEAKNAFYVVGSKVVGTMSKVSKLAFEKKEDALNHIKKYGGKIVSFEKAFEMTKSSLTVDDEISKKKKEKKVYPMGKKIFTKMCNQDIDPTDYLEINELKDDLLNKKLCKPLKEKQLQMVALYLWEVKRRGESNNEDRVQVHPTEKCPVCGMFTYKYPKWAAQIFYKHGDHDHHYSFDGVKDLMKFYFNPTKWGDYGFAKRENISKILVTDYYSQKAIDGTKAFYVIRSDIYGPMGHELIPFASENDAKTFKQDHHGKRIIKFQDIVEEEVYKLDTNEI